ncbi:hypothetical protein Tco_0165577, partial [Tanacetum coccineum]
YPELDLFLDSYRGTKKIDDDWDLQLNDLDFGDIPEIKGALIEKEDPGAFVILIRLEAKINLNALADTGSDINVMPYRVYKELDKEEVKPVNRGITMLNHSKAEHMGLLKDVLC